MKKSDGYNSPKGVANNAAQQQVRGKVSPINKQAIKPVAEPVIPATIKSTEKEKKS